MSDGGLDRPEGLERYAIDAPSEAMREIAAIAQRKRLTLGELGKLYAAARGTGSGAKTEPGNVRSHFLTYRPHDSTVLTYARALGIIEPERFVELFSAKALAIDRVDDILSNVVEILRREEAEYPEGATRRVIEHLAVADASSRDLYARAFQKAFVKQLFDVLTKHPDPMDALFAKLPAALDLRRVRRPLGTIPDALFNAWFATGQYFGYLIADDVAALIVGKLRGAGNPTDAMEAELRRRRDGLLNELRRHGQSDMQLFNEEKS